MDSYEGFAALGMQEPTTLSRIYDLDSLVLVYPTHPFPPELCKPLSELPIGVRELCLAEHLSVQLIELLSRTQSTLKSGATREQAVKLWARFNSFFLLPMADVERQICHGMIAVFLTTERELESLGFSVTTLFTLAHVAHYDLTHMKDFRRDSMIWFEFAVAGAFTCRGLKIPPHLDAALDRSLFHCREVRDWSTFETMSKQFFWTSCSLGVWRGLWEARSKLMKVLWN